ncbi:MAG: diphthine--ammonia ligase [Candidatus Bilamarchaeaceae archaeon]
MGRRVACLFSGGKDSVFALFWAQSMGFNPVLITIKPKEYSMMFHHPNIERTKLQAKALGDVEHMIVDAGDDELDMLKNAIRGAGAHAIVTGAIESEYQKQRIDKIGEELGIPTYSPLWHKHIGIEGGGVLMEEMLRYFETYLMSVSAEGFTEKDIGKPLGSVLGRKGIHPFLEGGEGETYVCDAPFFKKRIVIEKVRKTWDGVRGVGEIEKAKLVGKERTHCGRELRD